MIKKQGENRTVLCHTKKVRSGALHRGWEVMTSEFYLFIF